MTRPHSAAPGRRSTRPVTRTLLALCTTLGLAACVLSPRRPEELSITPHTVLLVVPAVPQEELHECGLASLATLCGFHGVTIPAAEQQRLAAIAREWEGLSGAELRAVLIELGMEAFLFQGSLDWASTGLYHQIDHGRLPLVMISRDGETLHTCLVTGYDRSTESVYLYDPVRGHLRLGTDDFDDLWTNARRFTLLALPREETPEEASAAGPGPTRDAEVTSAQPTETP
ncbi:MAG TPA: cysteine peptidase family C39 domain-containing protein [Planctomycetota bacterium]